MRLQHFLNEAGSMEDGGYSITRSKSITEEDFTKQLKSYSNIIEYYAKGNKVIYRGIKGLYGNYGYVNPSLSQKRKSAYTFNYYTLISSEDSSWKGIPPRDKSIVCSTSYDKASGYETSPDMSGTLCVVLPKNGSNIAQTHTEDFWGSFQHAFGSDSYPLGSFNRTLNSTFNFITKEDGDDSITDLKKVYKKVDEWVKENGEDKLYNLYLYHLEVIKEFYKGDFYKMLTDIFNPKKGNIVVSKSGHKLRDDVEVWTDGECLLVADSVADPHSGNDYQDYFKLLLEKI